MLEMGMDSLEDDTENLADETDENAVRNSIFDKDNIFARFGAKSEIKSVRDT